jgi:nicotinamide-nucleotide amidase
MLSGIITVGNEILGGHIRDANSHWLTRRLMNLGIDVKRICIVGDDIDEIKSALSFYLDAGISMIFVCGGMGSTPDDKTAEAVSDFFDLRLIKNEEIKRQIETKISYLQGKKAELPERMMKMTYVPEGCKIIKNDVGLAPGILIELDSINIFLLPGVPNELEYIFENEIAVKIAKFGEKKQSEEICVKSEESLFNDLIKMIGEKYPGLTIGMYPHYGEMRLLIRLIGKEDDVKEASDIIKREIKRLNLEML